MYGLIGECQHVCVHSIFFDSCLEFVLTYNICFLYSICHHLPSFWSSNSLREHWHPTTSNSRSSIWTLCTVCSIFICTIVVTVLLLSIPLLSILLFATTSLLPLSITTFIACTSTYFII
ncbi:hypothetical protein K435DRAFT_316048 [Dendrothele bispora CBS 962.96]|uniref:Uncharacterized protein n=1 Tax=Dendrothele bispora (strain CBS 962.96) TaxID=1314807 RepID=A0A4S8MJD5_DENBC|nr:hypothetical protein K435DRAFT_316048 [Dendrothele bispora CBS 962.96]